jgi:hypothetical protein
VMHHIEHGMSPKEATVKAMKECPDRHAIA